jgi:glycosyltransferase involved in cell wall biosynthesis
MTPRLTIAIPTLNRADLVVRAIESALAQTSPDIEIIVSDNGSVDDTPNVLAHYAGGKIRTFRHDSTMPAGRHAEFLINQARGDLFLGLSDDDFLEPEFVAEVLVMFDSHPELSFVYTGCLFHYDDYQVPAVVGPPIESGADFLAAHYADQREICWCACVTRVRDLREIGTQAEDRVLGDMYLWTKLAFRGPIGCVPHVLSNYVLYRSKNDNISHGTPPVAWARESRLLADEVIETSRKAGASAEYLSTFESASRQHIARSTANQFVWTRIRGASLLKAWQWSIACLPYLSWNFATMSRLGAALILPRAILRNILLKGIENLSASRTKDPAIETGNLPALGGSE